MLIAEDFDIFSEKEVMFWTVRIKENMSLTRCLLKRLKKKKPNKFFNHLKFYVRILNFKYD